MTQKSNLLFLSKSLTVLPLFENSGVWDFVESEDVIFVDLHVGKSFLYFISNGANLLLVSQWISFDPVSLVHIFITISGLPIRFICIFESLSCLVLSSMGMFVVFLSLLPDIHFQ